jgi:hypothetical protein
MSTAAGDLEGMVRCTSMRSRLRTVTESLHRSAESHFGLQDQAWNRDRYRRLLARLWGFHAPHAADAMERAAIQTFAMFDRWFDPALRA